jgi:DNA (cytosine-5)-methyltransferase 1
VSLTAPASLPAVGVESYDWGLDERGQQVVHRALRRRDGRIATSVIAAPDHLRHLTARDAHDLAWLTSQTRPVDGPRRSQTVTIADIFSGCGGLSVGAREAARALGYESADVFAVDTSGPALDVFRRNFPTAAVRQEPIEDIVDGQVGDSLSRREKQLASDLAGLTLALGGPPCQGHSDLNNHTRRQDPKNALYLRMARFIEVARPQYAIIENVPGVANDRSGVVGRAAAALSAAGYAVEMGVVSAAALGAPQARRRHLMLASRTGQSPPRVDELAEHFGTGHERPVMWAIADLADRADGGVFDSSARHSPRNQARIRHLFDNDLYDLPNEERPDCHRLKQHSYTAVYGRMRPDRAAPTITRGFGSTGQGRFVHPTRARTLTPHEAARLQGFPDFFDFRPAEKRTSLAHMIGNAVPSRLAYAAVAGLMR